MTSIEWTSEQEKALETRQQREVSETEQLEQQEMEACVETAQQADLEQQEMDEGAKKMGYSSNYYMHEAERAIANGNDIAYKNAMKHYAHEKAKEETKKIHY